MYRHLSSSICSFDSYIFNCGLFYCQTDFRGYTELLKQAVSLGRRMQDPLMEFSQLCNADEDILCLKFHPLQVQVLKHE